ncbi:MAG: UDP-N-acetylmuramoyl-tripeptide--D-alanyl-D-alanine ligase [Candidatus Gastranaerophilales bacterium]|nr:UDP-N-acetylmuramoyl-tripeptide--D-alanyl-D-alanine ligase [Candidatus Gastranaerophilales bacterium]
MIRICEIAELTNAEIISGSDEQLQKQILNFSTDTRTLKPEDFYIPLKGEKFDGEKFIDSAIKSGAAGYFTTGDIIIGDICALKVKDTREAYLKLANYRRKQVNPKVVMITGSSGKTTTKELVYSVCSQKYRTIKTDLNHNNEIGFCQTVFSIADDTEILIIEAGMRGTGEIELISKYAEPDISVISNVGTAHIGRLGSVENIAKAKCEITKYQNTDGVLIAHNDDLIRNTTDFKGEKIYYSINDTEIIKQEIGCSEFIYKNNIYRLNIEGDYNIENSLAAIETGLRLNISPELISKGLSEYKPIEKRWQTVNIGGYKIINDSYNANPESMRATLKTVFKLYKDIVVILGDMGELGENEVFYHTQIGQEIELNAKNNPDLKVITVGELSKNISDEVKTCFSKHFDTNRSAARYILDNIKIGTTIFLKASRTMKLEEILACIKGETE